MSIENSEQYYIDDLEDKAVRIDKDCMCFAKHKGGVEGPIGCNSNTVTRAQMSKERITKKEYENY